MKKPVIAIDVDDVLAHSIEHFRLEVNQRTGAALTPEHFREPDDYHRYLDRVLQRNGIDYAAIKDEMFQQMIEDQSHILPNPGAIETLKHLAKYYDLAVITARDPEWEPQTQVWLQRHFPDVFTGIHFAGNRHDPARKTKGDMCLEAGAAYLIDDNPEHAREAQQKGVTVVLFGDYGWHAKVPKEMTRCKTWQEVMEYFDDKRG